MKIRFCCLALFFMLIHILITTIAMAGRVKNPKTTPEKNSNCSISFPLQEKSPLCPGESLSYEILVSGIYAGRVYLKMGTTINAKGEIQLKGLVKTNPLLDKFKHFIARVESIYHLSRQNPLRYNTKTKFNNKKRWEKGVYLHNQGRLQVDCNRNARKTRYTFLVPRDIQDMISLFYYYRDFQVPAKGSFCQKVYAGYYLWQVTGEIVKREGVSTPAGYFSSVLIEGHSKRLNGPKPWGKNFQLWISDDNHHLPIKLKSYLKKFGAIVLMLSRVQSPCIRDKSEG